MLNSIDRLHAALLGVLVVSCASYTSAEEQERPPRSVSQSVDASLLRLEKNWRPYTNKPNLGDTRWRVQMETLVQLARLGIDAVPHLENAASPASAWANTTRTFARKSLDILQRREAVRKSIADYGLRAMDTARVGQIAPDLALPDATGQIWRMSQFRNQRLVVLVFIVADT